MPMQVVGIRHVWMGVLGWLVAMPVAVFARWHGVVCAQVMFVVMGMSVFVFQRVVVMGVVMRFRKVQ